MPMRPDQLPHRTGRPFISDGGLETTLIFLEGLDLPHFAAFVLLESDEGRAHLARYFARYLDIAARHGAGFILDSVTWRANPEWGAKLGYDAPGLDRINREAVAFARSLAAGRPEVETVISGVIGPRGDGYKKGAMGTAEAQAYHEAQVASFAAAGVDIVSAYTITTVEEAAGVARAAAAASVPCAVSFTVETDGNLIDGTPLGSAIEAVDDQTGGSAAYFMVNCAHPAHFDAILDPSQRWTRRLFGLKANASTKSHAELDESIELDAGDPADLGRRFRAIKQRLPHLGLLGGCCGTDHRHVAAICEACEDLAA